MTKISYAWCPRWQAKMTLGLPVGIGARLNRLPAGGVGDRVWPPSRRASLSSAIRSIPPLSSDGPSPGSEPTLSSLHFEDNAGVIVNARGEMKGSAVTGPVGKEAAELWPRIASNSGVMM
ncbi:hypothetical protein DL769_007557 [Monosporascus sp. CRB-8-3]|nr:hypothetical protein DL769_007557 [Monosporascus sp. CRB-8-3]